MRMMGALCCLLLIFAGRGHAQPAGAAATLNQSFPDPRVSYLLFDIDGTLRARRWEDAATPVAPGSLLKPFVALAYGQQHGGVFPHYHCDGVKSRCWRPRGHGGLGLEAALAVSCNAYFLQLAAGVDRAQARQTLAHYGLAGLGQGAEDTSLIGLGQAWRESPLALAAAYLALQRERRQPVSLRVWAGLEAAASHGTSRVLDDLLGAHAAAAKTGTAACLRPRHDAGDGFTAAFYPADQPRLFLLVRVHNTTGAQSARVAAAMLRALGAGAR